MADWQKLKVVDLKAELKRRGLAQTGLKQELVTRLVEDDAAASQGEDVESAGGDAVPEAESTPEPASEVQQPTGQNHDTTRSRSLSTSLQLPDAGDVRESEPTVPEPAEPPQKDPTPQPSNDVPQSPGASPQLEGAESSPGVARAEEKPLTDAPPLPAPAEVFQDNQKRKRRSASPPPSVHSTKRLRQDDSEQEREPEMRVEQGLNGVSGHETTGVENGVSHTAFGNDSKEERDDDGGEAFETETRSPVLVQEVSDVHGRVPNHQSPTESSRVDYKLSNERVGEEMGGTERDIAPSLHPATTALYIKNFMRPLRPTTVQDYLLELASPPGASFDDSLIVDFYLDQIRTHAFAVFKNVSAAARARTGLHEQVWPDETNRKPLWVDYFPPEKFREWVDAEQSAGGGRAHSRWEATYYPDPDRDGAMTVQLEELGADTGRSVPPPPLPPASKPAPPPTAPRAFPGIEAAPSGPRADIARNAQRMGPVRTPLDDHVRSTAAGPTVYYQPVTQEVVQSRMDSLRSFAAPDPPRDLGRDINRYSFANSDQFVDRGREIFEGIRPPHRDRQGPGGRRGGGGGGGGGRGRRFGGGPGPMPPIGGGGDRYVGGGAPRRDNLARGGDWPRFDDRPRFNDRRPGRGSYRDRRDRRF